MFGKNDQHSRLCVMESLFEEFQNQMVRHMDNEEVVFGDLKSSLKQIIDHIDVAQKENWKATDDMKREILTLMDREYYTRSVVEKQNTELRASIITEINKHISDERAKTYASLRSLLLVMTLTATAFGWWYVNVAVPAAAARQTVVKVK